MAGLIKAALALHHRVIPPTPAADHPHRLLAGADCPFTLPAAARPWIHGGRPFPRRAGVSAFGFAGINAHAVLEEHSSSAEDITPGCQQRWESEAILLAAPDRHGLAGRAQCLLDWLDHGPNLQAPLKDLAFTLNTEPPAGACRLGLVVESTTDLRDRLRLVLGKLEDPACTTIRDARGSYFWDQPLGGRSGALAFVFAGEGAQYPGMLADLCRHFPEVRAWFDVADRVAREQGHRRPPSEPLFGGAERGEVSLWSVGTAVNAVLSAHWAIRTLLAQLAIRPDRVVGHSSGEILALASAGVLEIDGAFSDQLARLGTIFERLEETGGVPQAILVAVAADRARVEQVCREIPGGPTIALDNCPHQVIVAGSQPGTAALVEGLRGQGVICEVLPFARAYHTVAFEAALEPIRVFFDELPMDCPTIPIDSCAIAGPMPADVNAIRRLAVEQWARPVAFRSTIEAMYNAGARVFVEIGARGNLTGFIEDSLRGRPHFAVAPCLPRRSGLMQLNHLVASLFAQGVALRPEYLYARRRPAEVDLTCPWPTPRASELAVGFPEMRLSGALAARLRQHTAPCPAAVADHPPGLNGHADRNDPRPALIQAHLRTMDEFLETQRQVMDAYLASRPTPQPKQPIAPAPPGPWVGTIESLDPGRELVALRRLEMREDPVAAQHTLGGRRVSALDPTRLGLPVLPFTVMTEMLAQAAQVLAPGLAVVGLRDVRAHRWIRYEDEAVDLEIRARTDLEQPDEVHVAIHNRGPHAAQRGETNHGTLNGPVVEGRVIFGERREVGPVGPAWDLEQPRPCRFDAAMIYRDQWLFHGPALQAVVEIGWIAPGGIEGKLRVLPRRALFRPGERAELVTDPIVLDAFTHLLGCWGLDEHGETGGDVIFPLRLAELTIFSGDPGEGTDSACRITIREVQHHRVRVDADIVAPDGRVWMRLTGWEDWRFYWPGRYRDHLRMPDRVQVSEPLPLLGAPAGVEAVWLEPPADFGKPVWRDVLEAIDLDPEERAVCRAIPGPESRSTLRLWGRVAAKDAVRRIWAAEGKPPVYPADLLIDPDERGRPRLRSRLEPGRTDLPAVSIAHTTGVAVALAAADPNARVGIDVEPIADRSPEFEGLAFTAGESACLDRLAPAASGAVVDPQSARAEWVARLWCAKEAVAKATGLGFMGGPGTVTVVAADRTTGQVAVALGPDLAAHCPGLAGHPLRAVTARHRDHVWAWTLGERIE
jgi:malonyl CoA-acyl carrier protein transacylase/phosphopantetheinyl transferase (holo-ACP synthase)